MPDGCREQHDVHRRKARHGECAQEFRHGRVRLGCRGVVQVGVVSDALKRLDQAGRDVAAPADGGGPVGEVGPCALNAGQGAQRRLDFLHAAAARDAGNREHRLPQPVGIDPALRQDRVRLAAGHRRAGRAGSAATHVRVARYACQVPWPSSGNTTMRPMKPVAALIANSANTSAAQVSVAGRLLATSAALVPMAVSASVR